LCERVQEMPQVGGVPGALQKAAIAPRPQYERQYAVPGLYQDPAPEEELAPKAA